MLRPLIHRTLLSSTTSTTRNNLRTMSTSTDKSDILKWAGEKDGQFKRQVSAFRDEIKQGGKFEPEKGRYHLYVSLACPWAHRALIVRKLKGLEDLIETSTVHPYLLAKGWHFSKDALPAVDKVTADKYEEYGDDSFPASTKDDVYGVGHLRDLYFKAEPGYDARFTVPIVWDKKNETIVSNESSEIIRNLNKAFNTFLKPGSKEAELDLYPDSLKQEIDGLNDWVYNDINNGVYKSGFATTQAAYESNVVPLFKSLDRIEEILKGKDFLVGGTLTEADVRLYTTIIRFDPVYVGHFKCNLGTIRHDYPEINRWLKNLYWNYPAFKETTDFTHIKAHYYHSHKQINNTGIVPMGPKDDIESL